MQGNIQGGRSLPIANGGATARRMNDSSVLRVLLQFGQASCAQIRSRVGLSLPTVYQALARLESAGLVSRVPGGRDRPPQAVAYAVAPDLVLAVGIRLTSRSITMARSDLSGRRITEASASLHHGGPDQLSAILRTLLHRVDPRSVNATAPVRHAVVALSPPVPGAPDELGQDTATAQEERLRAAVSEVFGGDVHVEQDAAVAAIAASREGGAHNSASTVVMWAGDDRRARMTLLLDGAVLKVLGRTGGSAEDQGRPEALVHDLVCAQLLFDPHVLMLCGELADDPDKLLRQARERFDELSLPADRLLMSGLDEEPVLAGAALLAADRARNALLDLAAR